MEEINKEIQTEKIEGKLTECKTFSTWLQSYLNRVRNNPTKVKILELQFILQEILDKYKQFHPKKFIEIEIIDGWKSVDNLEIFYGFDKDFIVKSHIKDKKTGNVSTITRVIKKEDVNRLIKYIKTWKINESHKCYDFAPVLNYRSWKDLWRERKIYFQIYYFPIKILEAMKIIDYGGRGKITRLK